MTPKATKQDVKPSEKKEVTQPVAEAVSPMPPAATPKPEVVSKQQQMIEKLKLAWQERGVDLKAMTTKQDGKFIIVNAGPEWPDVAVGPTGGISLPQIRSYAKAWDAAVDGLAVWQKQQARDTKKAAQAVPAKPVATAAQPEATKEETPKPTPAAKKQKQHAELEKQMA